MTQTKLLGLTSLVICLIGCGQTAQKNALADLPDSWKVIDEPDYAIQYPDSFDLNKPGQMGTSFILFSQQISQQDRFRENVNLIIQDLTGQNIDLNKYVEISEGQIETMITSGKIIDSKRIKTDDSEFQKVVYTGVQGQYDLKFEQYYWVAKDKAFVLTLTCDVTEFDKYKEVGEKIMNSFEIK